MTVRDLLWTTTLRVWPKKGLERSFCSIHDAHDYLENEWPFRDGEYHLRAITACKGALHRVVSAEVAREAFIAACLEASMDVEPDKNFAIGISEIDPARHARANSHHP